MFGGPRRYIGDAVTLAAIDNPCSPQRKVKFLWQGQKMTPPHQLIRQLALIAALVFCMNSKAEEVQLFLRDVTQGTLQAQRQLEVGIEQLGVAREHAHRTLLLRKCKDPLVAYKQRMFDEFAEVLLSELGSSDPDAVTMFTVHSQMRNAIIQNHLTDAQVELVMKIRRSSEYVNFVEFLSFQRAGRTIATRSTDVVTGNRATWVISKALAFLRTSSFYPLLLANSSDREVNMLMRDPSATARPSDVISNDAYFGALVEFFTRQFSGDSLREKLPQELQLLFADFDSLNLDGMYKDSFPILLGASEAQSKCNRQIASDCVGTAWFASSDAVRKTWPYEHMGRILIERYPRLCNQR
jgi:hypothetical protein